MGNFRIQIDAGGGHGCDRTAMPGEPLAPLCESSSCPDCAARRFIADFRKHAAVSSAEFTHWPYDTGAYGRPEIVDDLLADQRRVNSFQGPASNPGDLANEHIMQYFAWQHLPPHQQEISKPFAKLAMRVWVSTPCNPERTAALRKLLEAKDAAVRAMLAKP